MLHYAVGPKLDRNNEGDFLPMGLEIPGIDLVAVEVKFQQ